MVAWLRRERLDVAAGLRAGPPSRRGRDGFVERQRASGGKGLSNETVTSIECFNVSLILQRSAMS